MFYNHMQEGHINSRLYFQTAHSVILPIPLNFEKVPLQNSQFYGNQRFFSHEEQVNFVNLINISGRKSSKNCENKFLINHTQTNNSAVPFPTLNQIATDLPTMVFSTNNSLKDSYYRSSALGEIPQNYSTEDASDNSHGNAARAFSKVPTKEDLYKLSTLIQNTNSDFEILNSSELAFAVERFLLTNTGLYISKNLCGFNWEFEIFFLKNKGTNRNRRHLRCKHKDCGKIFK